MNTTLKGKEYDCQICGRHQSSIPRFIGIKEVCRRCFKSNQQSQRKSIRDKNSGIKTFGMQISRGRYLNI